MTSRARLSARTGVVGAWATMVGFVLLVVVERLVTVLEDGAMTPSLTTAGIPIGGMITAFLVGLYNGGSVSMFVGLLLVFVGWYQVITMA